MVGGNQTQRLNLNPTETVFNDGSVDLDFRVESNGNANMLFVDGGNDRVGIGTTSPSTTLTVVDDISIEGSTPTLALADTDVSNNKVELNYDEFLTIDIDPNNARGNTGLIIKGDGTERMRIDSSGRLLVGSSSAIASAGGAIFQQSQSNNNWTQYVENSASSGNIYGQLIKFTGQSPDNNSSAFLSCQDSSSTKFIVYSDGDAYNHDGTFAQLSDRRIKDNITDANSQWEDIKAMRFVNYQRKDDIRQYGTDEAKVQLGVIGQELEAVSPNLVRSVDPTASDVISSSEFGSLYVEDDDIPEGKQVGDVKDVTDKVKGVAYSILYMKSVKALQEAMTRIETLEAKVTALESA